MNISKMQTMQTVQSPQTPSLTRVKYVPRLKRQDSVYDPIRLESGSFAWMKYSTSTGQEIITELELDGTIYKSTAEQLGGKNLILPSGKGSFSTLPVLFNKIKDYLSEAIKFPSDLDLVFSAAYATATWNYDKYKALNYLAFTGNPGTGKSAAQRAVRSVSYNTFVGSGGDTSSVLKRSIDKLRGTVSLDESQQNTDDPGSDYHKILALGNEAGQYLNCSGTNAAGEITLESFHVFGPKIFSGRSVSVDEAILSRTFDIKMYLIPFDDISHLSDIQEILEDVASDLRNDLLAYSQKRNVGELAAPFSDIKPHLKDSGWSPREVQVYSWLLRECPDEQTMKSIIDSVNRQRTSSRSIRELRFDAQVLYKLFEALEENQNSRILLTKIVEKLHIDGHSHAKSTTVAQVVRNHEIETGRTSAGNYVKATTDQVRAAIISAGYSDPRATQDAQSALLSPDQVEFEDTDETAT